MVTIPERHRDALNIETELFETMLQVSVLAGHLSSSSA